MSCWTQPEERGANAQVQVGHSDFRFYEIVERLRLDMHGLLDRLSSEHDREVEHWRCKLQQVQLSLTEREASLHRNDSENDLYALAPNEEPESCVVYGSKEQPVHRRVGSKDRPDRPPVQLTNLVHDPPTIPLPVDEPQPLDPEASVDSPTSPLRSPRQVASAHMDAMKRATVLARERGPLEEGTDSESARSPKRDDTQEVQMLGQPEQSSQVSPIISALEGRRRNTNSNELPPRINGRKINDADGRANYASESKDTLDLSEDDTVRAGSFKVMVSEAFTPGKATEVIRKNSTGCRSKEDLSPPLELHPTWEVLFEDFDYHAEALRTNGKVGRLRRKGSVQLIRRAQSLSLHGAIDKIGSLCECNCERLIQHPSSRNRLTWDILGILFLIYDLMTVPLQVFDFEDELGKIGRYVTSIFWTCDIFASFFVGFHKMGMVVMEPMRIAINYIKSWFIMDLILVSIDWVFLILGVASANARAMRFTKFARGMRALRLLRLMKFHMLISDMSSRVRSEYARTVLSIGKIIIIIVCANHFIACGFYGLSHVEERNWVQDNFVEGNSIGYKYWTSMHWSLTQFTPASMEVVPTNTLERIYTVIVLLFALVTFSSFVSSITSAMTHLRNVNARRIEQDGCLRRYLFEHEISSQLTSRVLHYFQDRQQQNRRQVRTKEEDVELFKVLPQTLKFELRQEAYKPTLLWHPVFRYLDHLDPEFISAICRSAISERRLIVRDELFGHGVDPSHMIFMTEGILRYKYVLNGMQVFDPISKGDWVCEVALWANRAELFGPFVAETNCELLMIDRIEFRSVAEKNNISAGMIAKYASLFIEEVSQIIKRCRWQSVVYNEYDIIQEIAQRSFEVEAHRNSSRISGDSGEPIIRPGRQSLLGVNIAGHGKSPGHNVFESMKDALGIGHHGYASHKDKDTTAIVPVTTTADLRVSTASSSTPFQGTTSATLHLVGSNNSGSHHSSEQNSEASCILSESSLNVPGECQRPSAPPSVPGESPRISAQQNIEATKSSDSGPNRGPNRGRRKDIITLMAEMNGEASS